eukprot:GILJ01015326.1.p1 GENE.GILJ01015326.1~~GILJ01015326.1.p1  ORF type:complete len:798 (+),score=158.23 GILJ01015326.1:50-2395(+)
MNINIENENENHHRKLIKIYLMGDNAVGKTTWLHRLSSGTFRHKYQSTGRDVVSHIFDFASVTVEVLDVGSQWSGQVDDGDGVVVMFNYVPSSYHNVIKWAGMVSAGVPLVLVHNVAHPTSVVVDTSTLAHVHYERMLAGVVGVVDICVKRGTDLTLPLTLVARHVLGNPVLDLDLPLPSTNKNGSTNSTNNDNGDFLLVSEEADIAALQQKLADRKRRIKGLEAQVYDMEVRVVETEELKNEIKGLNEDLAHANREFEVQQRLADRLQKETSQLKIELDAKEETIQEMKKEQTYDDEEFRQALLENQMENERLKNAMQAEKDEKAEMEKQVESDKEEIIRLRNVITGLTAENRKLQLDTDGMNERETAQNKQIEEFRSSLAQSLTMVAQSDVMIADMKNEISLLNEALQRNLGQYNRSEETLKQVITRLRNDNLELNNEKEELLTLVEAFQTEIKGLKCRDNNEKLMDELNETVQQKAALEQEIAKLKDMLIDRDQSITNMQQEISQIHEALRRSSNRYERHDEAMGQEVTRLKKENSVLNTKFNTLRQQKFLLEQDLARSNWILTNRDVLIAEMREEIYRLRDDNIELKEKLGAVQNVMNENEFLKGVALEQHTALTAKIATLKQELDEKDQELQKTRDEFRGALADHEEKLDQASEQVFLLTRSVADLKVERENQTRATATKAQMRQEFDAQIAELTNENETLQSELETLKDVGHVSYVRHMAKATSETLVLQGMLKTRDLEMSRLEAEMVAKDAALENGRAKLEAISVVVDKSQKQW